jgi:hypothetical protein
MFKVYVSKFILFFLPLLLLLAGALPASAVDYKDNGGNYAGVQWHFEIRTSRSGMCGSQPCFEQSPNYWVAVTTRINGQTCNESQELPSLGYEGKWYYLCGAPAIIESNDRTYYNVPGIYEGWLDSPEHCYSNSIGSRICDQYWTVNW